MFKNEFKLKDNAFHKHSNIVESESMNFIVTERFANVLAVALTLAITAGGAVALLLYFKKSTKPAEKKQPCKDSRYSVNALAKFQILSLTK